MGKIISYKIQSGKILLDKIMGWNEINEKTAQKESYNGQCPVEDDGQPETSPTQLDRVEAQVTYTAMMTDTLLEV